MNNQTQEKWSIDFQEEQDIYKIISNEPLVERCVGYVYKKADAILIAESGTVAHERGLTPRQLVESLDRARLIWLFKDTQGMIEENDKLMELVERCKQDFTFLKGQIENDVTIKGKVLRGVANEALKALDK